MKSESVVLRLTAPANANIGEVRISDASLKACNFADGSIRVIYVGPGHYALQFANNVVPGVLLKNGKPGQLKASYNLKLEVWAEGTYKYDSSNRPVGIGYYDKKGNWVAKTKPAVVTVKVNLK